MTGKTIAITSQKGGAGKTTTALFLTYGLSERGYHVLVIDLDQQADSTYSLMHGENFDNSVTSFEAMTRQATAKQAIISVNLMIDLIPASSKLAQLDVALAQNDLYRADLLKTALSRVKGEYDYIIIDTPPALGLTITNALTVADYVLIPTQADMYHIKGLADLSKTLKQVNNPSLKIAGILIERYNANTVFSKVQADTLAQVATMLNTRIFKTKIREAIAVKEAQQLFKPLDEYSKHSKVTQDVNNFISEFLEVTENEKQAR